MMRIDDYRRLPADLRGGVVAIGNFDGVHRGHQAVLEQTRRIAEKKNAPTLALTFEPNPRSFFRPQEPIFRLTPAPMRARLLSALGFDGVVEQHFTREFADLDAEQFVLKVLVEGLGVAHIVMGYDFHFGKGRGGSPTTLVADGLQYGFGVTVADVFTDEGGLAVSSTRIRDKLRIGGVEEAAGLLGYRFCVEGTVIEGQKLGRKLGFPTANMALPAETELKHGIYAVRLRRADGRLHDGVASFGLRPTVDNSGVPLLETFIFDFSETIYGETCAVSLFSYLRGEEKFDNLDMLVTQMKRDEAEARALLSSVRPLSSLDGKITFNL